MRLAVTGASGFCGAAVARTAASRGARVYCLGRRPGPVGVHRPWDATREHPDLSGVDAVIHLAAAVGDPGPRDEARYHAVNVDGTRRLLEAAVGRPVVWVSSASVYRLPIGPEPITEDHPTDSHRNAYGRTKAAGERLALDAGAVVLRPRAVYGPGDPHLLPRLRRLARGGVAVLPGPDVPLSLTAVENLADACLAALHWTPGAYNIADAAAYRRDHAIRTVLAATGTPVRVVHVPVTAVSVAAVVAETLARLLPWRPMVTRYALEQVSRPFVLDVSRAAGQGWRPTRSLADFVSGR